MDSNCIPTNKKILFFDFSGDGTSFLQNILLANNNTLFVVYTDIIDYPIIHSNDCSALSNTYPGKVHFTNEYSQIVANKYDLVIAHINNDYAISNKIRKFISSFSSTNNIPLCTVTFGSSL